MKSKFIYILLKSSYLISGIIIPFILLLKKHKDFCFIEIHATRIGNFATNIDQFFREIEFFLNEKNKFYFVYFTKPISNNFLLELYSRKAKNLTRLKFLKGYLLWKFIVKCCEFWSKEKLFIEMDPVREKYDVYISKLPIINLTNEDEREALCNLEKLRITKDSKWICIHNRDSAYLDWAIPNAKWNYHNYRDWSINDMLPACDYFTKKGYYVIRVGKKTNEKIKSKNPKIIDFVNCKERNDLTETFLIANCVFYFGSSSGINNVARIFCKPVFEINVAPLVSIFSIKRKYPCIFKRVFDLEKNKILTIKEMEDKKIFDTFHSDELKKKKVKFVNNTSDEILSFAIEAEKRVSQLWKQDSEFKDCSKKFSNEISKSSVIKDQYYNNLIGQEFLRYTQIN